MTHEEALGKWHDLALAGIVISVCHGPSQILGIPGQDNAGVMWTVLCIHDRSGQAFDVPYAARDFAHCIEIADTESRSRGWLPPTLPS